jgi:phosphoribosylamine--glycine ligase
MANVMVLGSGGREHALAWWFHQYGHSVMTAPGNAGTAQIGMNVPCDVNDLENIISVARKHRPVLVVPGPEAPLVAGVVDEFRRQRLPENGIRIIGPPQAAAELEGSKIHARRFGSRHDIPQPEFEGFDADNLSANIDAARHVTGERGRKGLSPLHVVKADGLCGGKGVMVCDDNLQVQNELQDLNRFKDAGRNFLLEQKLVGPEASITTVVDSKTGQYRMFPHSTDFKRRFEGDKGPNTGGMGSYSPTNIMTPDIEQIVKHNIIGRTMEGLQKDGIDYQGILYFAIMMHDGLPHLIEYNCRSGDPETQAFLRLANTNPYNLFMGCLNGNLKKEPFAAKPGYSCCVVLAHEDYPKSGSKGELITFDPRLNDMKDIVVFHAGTALDGEHVVTNGGRVLAVTAYSTMSMEQARIRAYLAAELIDFKGKAYRDDIAKGI